MRTLDLITFTPFSKHIPAANEFTISVSLSDPGHPDPNMRSPRVIESFQYEVRQEAQQINLLQEIQGRSTESSLPYRKEADTVMTGICLGLKSTVTLFINSIPCHIISVVAAFS